jgi:hypothetical protein
MAVFLAGAARADEVTDWHEHLLTALVTGGSNPLVSGRDAALVSAAMFDAVNGIERRYAPIYVIAHAPRGASKRAAAVEAAYTILISRYPAQATDLNAKRSASLAAIADGGKSIERGVAWGHEVAQAILDWRSTDGFSSPPPPFLGGSDVGQWRPTPPGFAPGLMPQFATMTPWGIQATNQFRPSGPPALDSAEYLLELSEVWLMGSATSALRTADETDASLFWNSGSATYLWNHVAINLSAAQGANLSENAHLLATLNLAMADALIACWDAKYTYVFWRPVTAIQLEDPTWTPLFATPNHPEYTSGHSSASSAAATVLADYFGDNTAFTIQSPAVPGWVRSYTSFSTAVDEVTDARVFAGIHFRTACEDGANLGSTVAGFILENVMGRIRGDGK